LLIEVEIDVEGLVDDGRGSGSSRRLINVSVDIIIIVRCTLRTTLARTITIIIVAAEGCVLVELRRLRLVMAILGFGSHL
jgi:hypothetical protein